MIDLLLLLLLGGAAVLGWKRGLLVSLIAATAFVVTGLPVLALGVAIGAPAILAFLVGGTVGLVLVAMRLDAISTAIDEYIGATGLGRTIDRASGAAVNVGLGIVLAWFVAAVASIVPANSPLLQAVRSSGGLATIVEYVPPQGTLGSIVLRSGVVPALNGPLVLAEAPDPAITGLTAVAVARSSVVQVRGIACGQQVSGTAWVAGPGLLLTNAHVVAGMGQVYLAGGPRYLARPATVTYFDPVNDVSVLTLDGTRLPQVIPISTRVLHGEPAAAIGFPLGGEQQTVAARIDRVAAWETEPVGGGEPRVTDVLAFRAGVQSGNSGGPIVAADGTAVGMVVAKGLGQRIEAAYGVPGRQLQLALAEGARRAPVGTGPCITD
ncbi:MAG: MarP family serine protease [Thermoleophilia bacterium]|nr:MarP family serine protease [Thermoleophilia bacterium]